MGYHMVTIPLFMLFLCFPAQLSSEQDIKASEVAFFGQVSIDLVNNLWNNVHDIY